MISLRMKTNKILIIFIFLFISCAPTGWVSPKCFPSIDDAASFIARQHGYDSACVIGSKIRTEQDENGIHTDTLYKVRMLIKK